MVKYSLNPTVDLHGGGGSGNCLAVLAELHHNFTGVEFQGGDVRGGWRSGCTWRAGL